jgi:hypothetical protein
MSRRSAALSKGGWKCVEDVGDWTETAAPFSRDAESMTGELAMERNTQRVE